ncbi:hypothetical protein QOZ80_3BG0254250 [Eleusine coracana subsp. coracana]|nr:hypothetical protein QOZ80_3BG0254250 [Eleusine coracana subsp. coracana]
MAQQHDRIEAEKACQRADELFRAGNICGAHRQASKAKRLCPSLPAAANALAAYEVVAAASGAAAAGSWRAVLGIRPGAAATHDAIKKQFRRLSLLVHPDKNGCAAAEEAFKLLRQAFDDALLAARPEPDEAAAAQEEEKQQQPRAAAATHEEKPQTRRRQETRPECDMQRDKDRISIYCMSCHKEFPARVGRWEHENGIKCAHCPAWLERPWPKKPPAPKEPPAGKRFTCSWRCPRCETQCTSTVYFGPWRLECKACAKYANVYVKGPNMATATT